jgi:hypothetical protein
MQPIYFSYFPGAGGRCLINCLHLCSGVIFNKPVENVNEKLHTVLGTVPDISHNDWWCTYEIVNLIRGCDLPNPDSSYTYDKTINDLEGYLPLVTHYSRHLACYEKMVGTGTRVKINPDLKFIDTAIKIKWPRSQQVPQPCLDLQQLEEWQQDVENIEFDLIIDDYNPLEKDRFDQQLTTILNYLDLKANQHEIDEYLKKYRNYHWSKIKELNIDY